VKEEDEDMVIRELFRRKLEKAEIIPDTSVKSNLMSKLAWKEFLHFIPTRFNIYYLAGILVATIAAVVILSSGSDNTGMQEPQVPDRKDDAVTTAGITTDVKISSQPVQATTRKQPSVKEPNQISDPEVLVEYESLADTGSRENRIIAPTGIDGHVVKNSLYNPVIKDVNKLQVRTVSSKIEIKPSVTEGCIPLKISFTNSLADSDSCFWKFGDGGISDSKNPEWIYRTQGEYKVDLEVYRSNGIKNTYSTFIKAYPKPSAHFEIAPEKAILPDDEIRFLNYSAEGVKYLWDFGDGNNSEIFEPVHKYDKFGNYNVQLVVTSEHGCTDSLLKVNAFSGSAFFIDFPNAFIPNPDGPSGGYYSSKSDESAQIFHPSFSGVSEFQLKIFNKAGMLLFETNDLSIGWDGYYQGQLCGRGVYIWKVRGNFRNGESFTKMGDLTLLVN